MQLDLSLASLALAAVALAVAVLSRVQLARSRRTLAAAQLEQADRERRSEQSQALLRTLLDASPLALVLCADDGRIVYENETARSMLFDGRTAAGQNFLQLVANGPEAFRSALLSTSDEMVSLIVEGRQETYHVARRTFDHLQAAHTLLVVRPVTRELARHDMDVLKKVVRLISHEVNNSLAPVSSVVHSARTILSSGERLDRMSRVLDTIDERARHLSAFIAGYAGLARLPRPVQKPVDWQALLSRLSPLFPDASFRAPAGERGFVDPTQLEQALINLLKNASEAGGPRDGVTLEVNPLADGAAELRVLDRGPGFSPEALESALLPFYTTKAGGSGVGLALVREVVEAHAGRLALGAREGGGASVTLWLPGEQPLPEPISRARLTLTRA